MVLLYDLLVCSSSYQPWQFCVCVCVCDSPGGVSNRDFGSTTCPRYVLPMMAYQGVEADNLGGGV